MKTLTYNMRNWRDDDQSVWERRKTQMLEQMKAHNPEIILLQEVCQAVNDPNPDNSMILWLSQQLPDYGYVQYANNGKLYYNPNFQRDEYEGLAILSKIPAKYSEVIQLGTGGDDGNPRICLATYFSEFHLYNCHLSTCEKGRQVNVEAFNNAVGIDEIGMINGDLNAVPKDPIFRSLPTWTDLWNTMGDGDGYTFGVRICAQSTLKLDERIDYFLPGAKFLRWAKSIKVTMDAQDANGYYASDHLGVIAEFMTV